MKIICTLVYSFLSSRPPFQNAKHLDKDAFKRSFPSDTFVSFYGDFLQLQRPPWQPHLHHQHLQLLLLLPLSGLHSHSFISPHAHIYKVLDIPVCSLQPLPPTLNNRQTVNHFQVPPSTCHQTASSLYHFFV